MTALPSSQARRRSRQPQQTVEIQIGTLALYGVADADAPVAAEALYHQLSRLAAQNAAFSPFEAGHLVTAPYAGGGDREVGEGVATALWAGLNQQDRAV